MQLQPMFLRERLPKLPHDLLHGRRLLELALELVGEDQLLHALVLNEECGGASSSQRGVALPHGPLQIMRVVVAAPDDEDILQPPDHEQLLALLEREIPRAQKAPLPC